MCVGVFADASGRVFYAVWCLEMGDWGRRSEWELSDGVWFLFSNSRIRNTKTCSMLLKLHRPSFLRRVNLRILTILDTMEGQESCTSDL